MATLRITHKTTLTVDQFIAALTDFSSGRNDVWPNSQPNYLVVHDSGPTWADATEGSSVFGGAWERCYYDWSDPHRITVRTLDSNIWTDRSSWLYLLEPAADGSALLIKASVTRFPRSVKARLLMLFVGTAGRPIIRRQLKRTIRTIEMNAS
jgi:hypothetical protein